jgi:hypothetical protein
MAAAIGVFCGGLLRVDSAERFQRYIGFCIVEAPLRDEFYHPARL